MNLQPSEAEQFFRIMHGLQFFVSQRMKMAPDVATLKAFVACDTSIKAAALAALYESPEFFDTFADENPEQLSQEDLGIVRTWKDGHRSGNYFIERHLRNYSIFIKSEGAGGDDVYCVAGISHPIEEIVPKYALPHLVQAVLLPFNGRIIYDGFLGHHRMSFGGGYRSSLREIYMRAKQNGRLIDSLEVQSETKSRVSLAPKRDWRKEIEALTKATAKLKGEKSPIAKEAFAMCRECSELARAATENADDIDSLRNHGHSVAKVLRRLETVLDRAEI